MEILKKQDSPIVTMLISLLSVLANLKGAVFMNVLNYGNELDEKANYLFNVGAKYQTFKDKKLSKLEKLNAQEILNNFPQLTNKNGQTYVMTVQDYQDAINSNIQSILNPDSIRSKVQTDAYEQICEGIFYNPEQQAIYIRGIMSKKYNDAENENPNQKYKHHKKAKKTMKGVGKETIAKELVSNLAEKNTKMKYRTLKINTQISNEMRVKVRGVEYVL